MSGHTCSIVGCSTSQKKNKVLTFHLIPESLWEYRLRERIQRDRQDTVPVKAYVCSQHFEETCFKPHGLGRTLKEGSMPTKFMPVKSIKPPPHVPRKLPCERAQTEGAPTYKSLDDVARETNSLPEPWVLISRNTSTVIIAIIQDSNITWMVEVDTSLVACAEYHGLHVNKTSLKEMSLTSLLSSTLERSPCSRILDPNLQDLAPLPKPELDQWCYRHIINQATVSGLTHTSRIRSSQCQVTGGIGGPSLWICTPCKEVQIQLSRMQKNKAAAGLKDLSKFAPLSTVPMKKISEELVNMRRKEKVLDEEVTSLREKIQKESVPIDDDLHTDLLNVMEGSTIKDQFVWLFWQEQQKAFAAKSKGMRWHPMMIRLAIMLHARSPAAYDLLRETGVLQLPGSSTLRDYTNAVSPSPGFSMAALEEIIKVTEHYKDHERFVVLLHDEMSIKSDLVFDRRSGHLIGFVDNNNGVLSEGNLATHVLTLMVVGVCTSLKMSPGFIPTRTCTSDNLYYHLWEAIANLEVFCNLKVIASTSDKASPNQRCIRIHGDGNNLCYKTQNLYAKERQLYFFSDPPHLIKTVRNNLANSGSGKNTRYLWNNGMHLLWKHISSVYIMEYGELRMTCLTSDHIDINPHSIMNVCLAAQVLSNTVGQVMQQYGSADMGETAKFILRMDRFFDCTNSRALDEGKQKRKPDLEPYHNLDDPRFEFLLNDFLGYLESWCDSINARQGFSQLEKNRMFLSYQTYEGLVVTVRSLVKAIKFLLQNGVKYVLSNVFCQDPLERHFGRHRAMGRRSENPNLWMFGYQKQKICLLRSLAYKIQPRGNIRAEKQPVVITGSPLRKINVSVDDVL